MSDRFTFTNGDHLRGELGTTALSCEVEWDKERKCWHATGSGFHGTSEYKPQAALNCFVAWMSGDQRWYSPDDPQPLTCLNCGKPEGWGACKKCELAPVPQTEGECPQCGGDGKGPLTHHFGEPCPTCSGTGKDKA